MNKDLEPIEKKLDELIAIQGELLENEREILRMVVANRDEDLTYRQAFGRRLQEEWDYHRMAARTRAKVFMSAEEFQQIEALLADLAERVRKLESPSP